MVLDVGISTDVEDVEVVETTVVLLELDTTVDVDGLV